MENKKLYVLSFCSVKKEDKSEDKDSKSFLEEYENLCLSADKKLLQSVVDCLEKVDKFRDLISSPSALGLPVYEYRYRIEDFSLPLLL